MTANDDSTAAYAVKAAREAEFTPRVMYVGAGGLMEVNADGSVTPVAVDPVALYDQMQTAFTEALVSACITGLSLVRIGCAPHTGEEGTRK